MMSIKSVKIPGVGMRNIKTALAAAFCALIYYFVGRSPAFACIGAIFGMGSDMEDSRKNGGNRLFGTLIGGLLGMVLFRLYLFIEPTGKYTLWLGSADVHRNGHFDRALPDVLGRRRAAGGVVLCILLFNTPVATYISYALNRILDTTIGVLVAWAVSYIFPRGWMEMWKERIKAHRAAK